MVSSEHRTGLYITIPGYFLCLSGAAFWAYRRMERLKHDDVADKLSSHFLGGRDFGPILTAGTLFASMFSGYTVIGVPNDAYQKGFLAGKWFTNSLGVVWGYFGTGVRLCRTSQIRNHVSPADFITDRYQSQSLRYMVVFLQVVPTLIYLSAQVVSIKSTFNSVFELDPDSTYPVILIMCLILIFEWVGGLNSVALTDCIQGFVMVASFVIIPSMLTKHYGGWTVIDPETYPKPEFFQTLSMPRQFEHWQFGLVNLSFFTLPHLMQRVYAAKSLNSLRWGWTTMGTSQFMCNIVGTFIGTVGVSILADEDGNPTVQENAFSAVLEDLMDRGTVPKMAATIAVTASLAAIMSTADSLIIAISQLVTMEIVHPLRPHTTPTEIGFIGKFTSLCSTIVAVMIGLLWDSGVADMTAIQFAISAQAVPAFLWGLFSTSKKTDCHPWVLFTGTAISTIYVIIIYFGYLKPNENARAVHAGVTGFLFNIFITAILEGLRRLSGGSSDPNDVPQMIMKGDEKIYLLYPGRPEWDIPSQAKYGGTPLTPELVWKGMEGIPEPFANPFWFFLIFFMITLAVPWTPPGEPSLAPPGSESKYAYPPTVFNGVPWYFWKNLVIAITLGIVMVASIFSVPGEFPPYNEKSLEEDSSDADVMEEDVKADAAVEDHDA